MPEIKQIVNRITPPVRMIKFFLGDRIGVKTFIARISLAISNKVFPKTSLCFLSSSIRRILTEAVVSVKKIPLFPPLIKGDGGIKRLFYLMFGFPLLTGELMGAFKMRFSLNFISDNKYHNHNNCTKAHENSKRNLFHFYDASFLLRNIARIKQNRNTQKMTIQEKVSNLRKKSLAKPAARIILEKSKSVFARFSLCFSSNIFKVIKIAENCQVRRR